MNNEPAVSAVWERARKRITNVALNERTQAQKLSPNDFYCERL